MSPLTIEWNQIASTRSKELQFCQACVGGSLKSTISHHVYPQGVSQATAQPQPQEGSAAGRKVVKHDHPEDGSVLESCFWNKKPLRGAKITSSDVLISYLIDTNSLRSGRFLQKLCLNKINHDGQFITPDQVVAEFNRRRASYPQYDLAMARFKEACCLNNLPVDGKFVPAEAVIKDFEAIPATLETGRFLAECCLKGRWVNGHPVATEEVVAMLQKIPAGALSLVRFKSECCLNNMRLFGEMIPPEQVVNECPKTQKGALLVAHFLAKCCMQKRRVFGQGVRVEKVVQQFMRSSGKHMGLAVFIQNCALKGMFLNGQQITAREVVDCFPDTPEGRLGMARFYERCCIRKRSFDGLRVRPEMVVESYRSINATLELSRFKQRCCLLGITIHGRQIAPEEVVRDFETDNRQLEKAMFFSVLALHAKKLHGTYLTCEQVLNAFARVPSDQTAKAVEYLIQWIDALPERDDSGEAHKAFSRAWQLINNAPQGRDHHFYHQCLLLFIAVKYGLPVNGKPLAIEQAWLSIGQLRPSSHKTCLKFYFLAHCLHNNLELHGKPVAKEEIMACLRELPAGALRQNLAAWLDQPLCTSAKKQNGLPVKNLTPGPGQPASPLQPPEPKNKERSNHNGTDKADVPTVSITLSQLNPMTQKALEIVQQISGICITGSFSRCLQGLCTSYNDIDIIGTEASVSTLVNQLVSEFSIDYDGEEYEVLRRVFVQVAPGCSQLKMPRTFNITLSEGDPGRKVAVLQANICADPVLAAIATVNVAIPGIKGYFSCASFSAEVHLMNETLDHLLNHLDPLTVQIQEGADFDIPRTIVFNFSQSPEERICAMLMRCLLTSNKAQQFAALLSEDTPLRSRLLRLNTALLAGLHRHAWHKTFVLRLKRWLPSSALPSRQQAFVSSLLQLVQSHPCEQEPC